MFCQGRSAKIALSLLPGLATLPAQTETLLEATTMPCTQESVVYATRFLRQQSTTRLSLAWLLSGLVLLGPGLSRADEAALALIQKREDILRSQTNFGRYRMQLVRPTWERTLAFLSWDDVVQKRSFTRLLAPAKDKDTTFLKVGVNLWTYLPKLERDIKLPPSMMLNAWMGSDFTNDDMVKVASTIEDYTHQTVERQGAGSDEVVTIVSLPKPEAAVVWGKL